MKILVPRSLNFLNSFPTQVPRNVNKNSRNAFAEINQKGQKRRSMGIVMRTQIVGLSTGPLSPKRPNRYSGGILLMLLVLSR